MKLKLIALMFSGLLAGNLAVSAQDNTSAATPTTDTNAAVQPDTSATTTAATNAPATSDAAPAQSTTSAVEQTPAASPAAPVPSASETSSSSSSATIPLIVMDEVPLTDAVKNLARQAGINYMLDPRINYGQPGPDGRPIPQPNVSIRWENITAEQALTALLGNYGLQLVEDPKTKISRVSIKDPAAPDPLMTKIIQLKYASPSNILSAVQSALTDKRSKVMGDTRTSQLVVVATEKELNTVNDMVDRLDLPTKQVLIEAKLLETQMNPSTVKGVDWTGTLAAQHVSFGNNALPGVAPTPPTTALDANGNPVSVPGTSGTIGGILNGIGVGQGLLASMSHGSFFNPATAFLNADGVNAVISFLNSYSETKVISAPRTVTLDNEPSHIEVGTDYPIINVTAGTANSTGGSAITYSNLTVRLDVTPRISANNLINLKVQPHSLRLDHVQTFNVGGQPFDVPIFDTRSIDTRVMIPSGHTLVMGGLIDDNILKQSTKVPVLGDIPGLGYLFRKDSKQRTKSNLIIFVTPTIVQDEDFQPTATDFLKTPAPTRDSVDHDWSAWDSGKAYDWSKIGHNSN